MATSTRGGATAPSTSSTGGMTSLLLTPFLALAFVLLHVVYQVNLFIRQAGNAIQSTLKSAPNRPASSYTSLQDLLDAHECPASTIRVPKHLAVVLADTAPSSIRLYVSTLFMRLRQAQAPAPAPAPARGDIWQEFRWQYDAAVEAKHASDVAAAVHLARISGVRELSVYRRKEWSRETVQGLCRILGGGYGTKVNFALAERGEMKEKVEKEKESTRSKYAELRRRTTTTTTTKAAHDSNTTKSSDSSSGGSPASSDSEMGGPSSLDETLASSYTVDSELDLMQEAFDASVDLRIGLYPSTTKPDLSTPAASSTLLVTLLSANDSETRFTSIISTLIRRLTHTYFSQILIPDIDSACTWSKRRFSASTLRKSWVSKRQLFTSRLDVAEVNRTLETEGYMGEPDLLVIHGTNRSGVRMLYGFPAWPVRLSDLFYDDSIQSRRGYDGQDFVKALRKFGKTQHRYGR